MRSSIRDALGNASVIEATDETTLSALATACRPAVIVLDATDPTLAGSVVASVRNDFRTALTPIVSVVDGAPSPSGFGSGDDYVVCPFDAEELGTRVRLALRRATARRGISALTDLPGNAAVEEAIARRLAHGSAFAVLHIDLDDFKAFNDRHGFVRGDEAIRAVALCITGVVEDGAPEDCFVGHLGGDDFVVLVPTASAEDVARAVVACVGDSMADCSVSIGVVDRAQKFASAADLGSAAADAKSAAKRRPGSSWSVHRA